jgi:hypothetical protein
MNKNNTFYTLGNYIKANQAFSVNKNDQREGSEAL